MRRKPGAQELLDGPLDANLLAGNLRDLTRINRWLGGAALSWRALKPFLHPSGRGLRLLDVGTGAADIPRSLLDAAADQAADQAAALHITATDIRPEIVDLAARATRSPIDIRLAPAIGIPEGAGSFDVVHASLVLHHLEPQEATELLREMGRVARTAVIVNDLDRGWRWLVGAWLLTCLLTDNAYTRHDAPLSVKRAHTVDEVCAMGRRAELSPVAIYWTRPAYRYAVVFVPGGRASA